MSPPEPDQPTRPALVVPALIGAVACLSFAAIFFRAAAPTHPLVSAGLRLVIAAAILAIPAARGVRAGRGGRAIVTAGAIGGLAYGLHFGAWVTSLGMTSIAASVTLVTATPLLLATVAVITGRDRPDPRLWAAIALGALGLLIIGGHDLGLSTETLVGDALALIGAVAMAGYLLVARTLGDALDVWIFSFVATSVGGAALLGAAVATGVPIQAASSTALGFIVLSALVPQLIGHTLLTWALRHASPTLVGMSTVGEPVGSTVLGWLLLSELPGGQIVLGCAVTLCGVVVAMARTRR